ncbi:MAG: hypothetical protein AB3N63_09905 [Puniceicoccaceae bacterium]
MNFQGRITDASSKNLQISNTLSGQSPLIGIPLAEIREIRLVGNSPSTGLLDELAKHKALLPLLDSESLERTLVRIQQLADNENWPELYQWTVMLIASNPPWEVTRRLQLWKAWACMEMKLFDEVRRLMDGLVSEWDAMEVPALLCWLMAKLEIRDGERMKALYWSLLPSLQIPAGNDAFADDLVTLSREWLSDEFQN